MVASNSSVGQSKQNLQKTKSCAYCGESILVNATKCKHCGEYLDDENGECGYPANDRGEKTMLLYGGFGSRLVANALDGVLCLITETIITAPVGFVIHIIRNREEEISGTIPIVLSIGFAIHLLIHWLYFAFLESSSWQASLGKKTMNLSITDLDGNQISFWRATWRFVGSYISALFFLGGFLIQPFTEKKQTLHDIMAGTLVVKNESH